MGSAESDAHDQVLDSVLVGPVPIGRHTFVFQVRVRVQLTIIRSVKITQSLTISELEVCRIFSLHDCVHVHRTIGFHLIINLVFMHYNRFSSSNMLIVCFVFRLSNRKWWGYQWCTIR